MMLGFNGGRIGKTNTVFTGTKSDDPNYSSFSLLLNGNETSGSDPNYSSVSLLLNGNGTNGSTTFTDSSSHGHTVTPVGNAQISTTQSKFGGASIAFDGNGDYLTVPSDTGWGFGAGDFTIECWLYLTQSIRHTILAVGTQVGGIAINIDQSGTIPPPGSPAGTQSIQICRPGTAVDNWFLASIPSSTWFHLAVCRLSSSAFVFINGSQIGSSQTNSKNFAQAELVIGYDGDKISYPFNGYIDDLRITKGVARYTSNFTPPTAQLLGNTITDSSSYGHTVTPAGNARISTAQSKFGGASMYFDGSGDYLTAPSNASYAFGTGDFTIEAWLYITNYGGGYLDFGGCIFDTRGVTQANWGNGLLFCLTTNGSLRVFSSTTISTSTSQISLNTWTHVALVRSAGSVTFYIGGQSAGTFSFSDNLSEQDMTIGTAIDLRAQNTSLKYNGYIDDLRITKGVARYTSNFTPPTAQLPGGETGTFASGLWTPREQCDAVRRGIWTGLVP